MSADNWAVCPKCRQQKLEEQEELKVQARNSYGTVSIEEFENLLAKSRDENFIKTKTTLREDYEIGIDEYGHFDIKFTASCSVCKFKYNYTFAEANIHRKII